MQGMQPPEEKGAETFVKGGVLIDGNGGKPLRNPVIVVQGRRIKRVGPQDEIKIPRNATVIDAGRCTLIPGMMDLHIHTSMFNCMTFHNHRVAQFEIMPHLQQM
jgi:imidazolonepropionase-like amidohydrolase